MVVTIELLNNNKLLNIMKNKYILYSVCEKLLVKNHRRRHCKNFEV